MPHGHDHAHGHSQLNVSASRPNNMIMAGLSNLAFVLAEAAAIGVVAAAGVGIGAYPGETALMYGLGFAIAIAVCTAWLMKRTGAMLSAGASMLRAAMWAVGMQKREYRPMTFGMSHAHSRGSHAHSMGFSLGMIVMDAVMSLAVIGAQIGAAIIGIVLIVHFDKAGLVEGSARTKPFGNFAGDSDRALFAGWILKTIVLLTYATVTTSYYKKKVRFVLGAIIMGLVTGGAVLVSYMLGVGSTLNFPIDVAVAISGGQPDNYLWISFLIELLGFITAFAIALAYWILDSLVKKYLGEPKKHKSFVNKALGINSEVSAADSAEAYTDDL